ncbi:MAG: hypothetical protein HC804_07550, partial [Anaerolineae bacterium]|nr:hypothetical protein [Anaerolineae bacterium]
KAGAGKSDAAHWCVYARLFGGGYRATTGQIDAVAEAGRTRVCTAVYEWQNNAGWQAASPPTIDSWDELLARLEGEGYGRLLFAGEISPDAMKQIRAANKEFRVALPAVSTRRAGYLAEIGWRRLHQHQVDDASSLAPIYLKVTRWELVSQTLNH